MIEAPARAKAVSPCSKFGGTEVFASSATSTSKTGELTGHRPRVRDVSISGFTFRGFKDENAFVIDFYAARNATVVGNRIKGNVAIGIGLGASVDSTIANNHLIAAPNPPNMASLSTTSSRKPRS